MGKRSAGEKPPDRDLTEEERAALEKFKEVDKQQVIEIFLFIEILGCHH